MTAFSITILLIILFIISFICVIKIDGWPFDIEDWIDGILMSIMIEVMIITVGIMLYGIWHLLYHLDWYGFFHDKVI